MTHRPDVPRPFTTAPSTVIIRCSRRRTPLLAAVAIGPLLIAGATAALADGGLGGACSSGGGGGAGGSGFTGNPGSPGNAWGGGGGGGGAGGGSGGSGGGSGG